MHAGTGFQPPLGTHFAHVFGGGLHCLPGKYIWHSLAEKYIGDSKHSLGSNTYNQRCNLTQWISRRARECFILVARLGKLTCHKKVGIFKAY